ncbi:MAG: hypothetical protein NTY47_06560, partial [Candidatus Omnitrophica bacterium]|nr:hypothetical protein [Candidatus Omnitrophota bacterium]
MPHQNHFTAFVVILLFPLSCALFSPKISLAQTYSQSVIAAQNNIDNNTGFIPNFPGSGNKKIITIQGTPALEDPNFGLHYETYGATPYLVTRTFAKSRNFYNSATQALTPLGSYTTYAPASPAATWVTTGNDGTKFLDGQGATSATVTDILERGLGMNNDASHDIIIEIGVLPNTDNIMRPARAYGISTYSTTASDYAFDANFDNIAPAGQMTNLKAYLTAWQKDALGSTTDPKWHGLTAVN